VVRGSIADGQFSIFYLEDDRVRAALSVGSSRERSGGRHGELDFARRAIKSAQALGPRRTGLADVSFDLGEL
jgi:hypothetical protein